MEYKGIFLKALLAFCQDRNLDANKIASLSGLSFSKLTGKSKFNTSNQQIENLWKNIIRFSNNELIGLHFGAAMQLAALNVVGQIIQTSNNVREALQHAASFLHLFTDFYTMQVRENPKSFIVSFSKNKDIDQFPIAQNQMGDFLVAFTLYELKGLLLENPRPIKIGLPTYKRENETAYQSILKCRVYKTESYTLEFQKEYLETTIITANYEIQTMLLKQMNQLQNSNQLNGVFSKRIFNYLISNSYLSSLPIEAVADNFNLSVRTLQRKLKKEGVSYLLIMEEVRKSLAIHYIENSSTSIKEISSVMGYSEPSAFVRAFKKWTRKTPSEYRKNE